MKHRNLVAIIAAAVLMFGIVSCRTSQQTRRSSNASGGRSSLTSSSDSMLIIQQKLIQLIDTMAGVLDRDTRRIRALEQEIARLKARLGASSELIVRPPQPEYVTPAPSAPSAGGLPPVGGLPYSGTIGSAETNLSKGTVQTYTGAQSSGVSIRDLSEREKEALLPPPPHDYTEAVMLFNARKYREALRAFDQLALTETSSAYTPNYVFWRGECLFALSRFAEAAIDFKAVADKYPGSLKGDDAQLKYAESLERLGSRELALLEYHRLLERYPLTEYRQRALSRIRSLQ